MKLMLSVEINIGMKKRKWLMLSKTEVKMMMLDEIWFPVKYSLATLPFQGNGERERERESTE